MPWEFYVQLETIVKKFSLINGSLEILVLYLVLRTVDFQKEKQTEKKMESIDLYNYCGIGLDAKMALNFHNLRKAYPYLFKSRV